MNVISKCSCRPPPARRHSFEATWRWSLNLLIQVCCVQVFSLNAPFIKYMFLKIYITPICSCGYVLDNCP